MIAFGKISAVHFNKNILTVNKERQSKSTMTFPKYVKMRVLKWYFNYCQFFSDLISNKKTFHNFLFPLLPYANSSWSFSSTSCDICHARQFTLPSILMLSLLSYLENKRFYFIFLVLMSQCGGKQCMVVEFKDEIPADLEIQSAELWVYRKVKSRLTTSYFSLFSENNITRR